MPALMQFLKNIKVNPYRLSPGARVKINVNVYFQTSKDFMKPLKTFIKPFWGTTKKCEDKNLY